MLPKIKIDKNNFFYKLYIYKILRNEFFCLKKKFIYNKNILL